MTTTTPVTADDLDLDEPVRRYLLRVTTEAVYEVWVDDRGGRGPQALAEYLNRDACDLSDLIRGESPIDGGISAAVPDEFDLMFHRGEQHGPWALCPFPGCETVEYPAYSTTSTCHRHEVVGCRHRNLPERTDW